MRVSSQQLFDSGVAALQQHMQDVVESQRQISSGQRHGKASDDPLAAGLGVQVQLKKAEFAMFRVNQDHVQTTLDQTDSQLSSLQQMLANMQQLMIQSSGVGLDNATRTQMAQKAKTLRDAVQQFSNAKDSSGNPLLKAAGGVGEVQVAPSIKLETGILKSSVMGDPTDATTVDVLDAMNDVLVALEGGQKPSAAEFDAIGNAMRQVSKAQVKTGVLLNLLDSARQASAFQETAVEQQRSTLMDTDPAQATADLARSNALLQAAQAIMARLDSTSLFEKI
jgi:flagellin-like hook-associated protein FlgL